MSVQILNANQICRDQLRDFPKSITDCVKAVMDGQTANTVVSDWVDWDIEINKEHELIVVPSGNGSFVLQRANCTVTQRIVTQDEKITVEKSLMIAKYVDNRFNYPELYIYDYEGGD